MLPLRRRDPPHTLAVSMTGIRMADRMIQVGCAHGGRLGAIAVKVGLSGQAVAVVPDEASATRARKGAAEAGALVEIEVASPTHLPSGDAMFDLLVFDNTGGLLVTMGQDDRGAAAREALRVLAPGGRIIIIGATVQGTLASLFRRAPAGAPLDTRPLLEAAGFRSPRLLAEREGLSFVEAIKPRG